jgi:hypothetical protein
MLIISRLVSNRPLPRCYFVRSAAGAPGFLPRRSDPPLIISCKNSKNSGGPIPEDPVRKDTCIQQRFCRADEKEAEGVVQSNGPRGSHRI